MGAAFREGAELAPEVADVCVIDVAVHDVTHDVAADRRVAARPGGLRDVPVVGVACREQEHDVVRVEPFTRCGTLDDSSDSGVDAAGKHQRRRWRLGVARRPIVVARAKPSASLMRRTRVAMSGASHVSATRT